MRAGPLLFVYGTLRRDLGAPAHGLLARHADYCDHAVMRGRLYDLGAYPCAVPSTSAADTVYGELYRLRAPFRTLLLLDAYEGVRGPDDGTAEYVRQRASVVSRSHGRVAAWVYLYRPPTKALRRVRGGDYVAYVRRCRTGAGDEGLTPLS